jgi:hypothetical protein
VHNPNHPARRALPPHAHQLTWPATASPEPRRNSSALLIVAALTTSGISLGGAFLQTVMSIKRFEIGSHTTAALILAAATLTLLFGLGGSLLAMLKGSRTGRLLVTLCCAFYLVNGTVTLAQGNIGSTVQLLIALPLAALWWFPATSRAMRTRSTGAQREPA